MILWFKNADGDERQIAYCQTIKDVHRSIDDFIAQANAATAGTKAPFKKYYTRTWVEGDRTWYDVGSWFEFFFTTENE